MLFKFVQTKKLGDMLMLDNFSDNFRRDDEEVFNEFRQKQVNFDLEERRNEVDSSRSWFIGALGGLVMAGIVGWFVLAPKYKVDGPEEVPVITKPQMPVKMQPSEPGNIEFAAQERTVYDIIEKKQPTEENGEVLTSEEEPNADAIEKFSEERVVVENNMGRGESLAFSGQNASVKDVLMSQNNAVQESVDNAVQEVNEEIQVVSEKAEEIKEEKVEQVKEIAKAPVSDTIITLETVRAAENRAKAEVANGQWQVQLMSSPNKAAVEKSWNEMSNKYALLKNVSHNVEKADLGAKGVFYRLKAGSFATKADASDFCSRLKAVGGNCFVAQK